MSSRTVDCERFRLRHFLERLEREGELERVASHLDLVDVAAQLEGNPKAVLFTALSDAALPVAGNVMGSRRRLALALETNAAQLLAEVDRRARTPLEPIVVSAADAPVQQIVRTGADADLTQLPVHYQHAGDGGLYISAGIDITRSRDGERRNVGYRRLMLRGRREAGIDLVAPSDLRSLYEQYVEHGERLPIAFAVGSHPADGIAAAGTWPAADEIGLMGALRGAPVPLVRCVSIDAEVPADAELVLEGYLDEHGWSSVEGPYGEFFGYYGPPKRNPVFHLTAITMRRDAVFQTCGISGRSMATTDTAQLNAIRTESAAWAALRSAVREPVAVYAPPACGGVEHVRVALRQRVPGEARNAIAAVFSSFAEAKHVFVVDPDVDIFSDAHMEWALATRFQADRDLVVVAGMRAVPLDPSLEGRHTGAKAGFDCTRPLDGGARYRIPEPPPAAGGTAAPVATVLATGALSFADLLARCGSRDGREIVRELEDLHAHRSAGGDYTLASPAPDGAPG